MTDPPCPVRARSITPEELSEANRRINALTRKLEWVKRQAIESQQTGLTDDLRDGLEAIESALADIETPPDIEPEMPEMTNEDLEHSLRWSERSRMKRGEFQPGDVEKIGKFLRLSEEQMLSALAAPSMQMAEIICLAEMRLNPGRNLLLLAIREPGAFRRALVKP